MRIGWSESGSFKRWLLVAAWFLFAVSTWVACNDSGPTGPTPPPPPPVTTTIPGPPPGPISPGISFSWDDTRGILVFPGTQATEGEILALDSELRGLGWPTPFYHVCAETSFWDAQGAPWPAGPDPFDSGENVENLKRFLNTTAEAGSQVMLDVYCTVRDATEASVSDERFFAWAAKVGRIAADYEHIVIHIGNEWWHDGSRLRGRDAMRTAHDRLRLNFMGSISSDDNFNPGDIRFNNLGGMLQWPDAHPWRTPNDPNRAQIEEMVRKNGGFLVISEPTAYSETLFEGCCTDDRNRITLYMNRCEETPGCVWTFHSTCGLGWPAQCGTFPWIPR